MFDRRNDEYLQARCYIISPRDVNSADKALYWGRSAQRGIADAEAMIRQLQEYQSLLYQRVREIEQAPYHHRVTLRRRRIYSTGKVVYYLTVHKVYDVPGIDPVEVSKTQYPGTDRRRAIGDFEAYLKSHPGIEAIRDIAKSPLER